MSTIPTQTVSPSLLQTMNGSVTGSTSAATATTGTGASSAASSASSALSAKNDFMTMLVAQLKFQDPTHPMDSAAMTSQLAQLSTVDGINQLNTSMGTLIQSVQSSQAYQASGLVGHTVMVAGNSISLTNSQASLGIQLPTSADSVKVGITNSGGQLVRTLDLGAQTAGALPVSWDGRDDAGKAVNKGLYSFQVTATSGGQAVGATGLNYAAVQSVSNASTGVVLNLDNKTSVSASSVAQIL